MIYRIACISRRTGNRLGYVMQRNKTNFHYVREFTDYASAFIEAQRLNRERRRHCDFTPEAGSARPRKLRGA